MDGLRNNIINPTKLNFLSPNKQKSTLEKYKKNKFFFPRTRCLPAIITEKYQGRIKQMNRKKNKKTKEVIFFQRFQIIAGKCPKIFQNQQNITKYTVLITITESEN